MSKFLFSNMNETDEWGNDGEVKAITFTGNIQEWLSKPQNVDALNKVLNGEACILCLVTLDQTDILKRLDTQPYDKQSTQ